ncbi:MAG: Hsp70 family protein [Planctomycetota bacterium]|nr:Hsp70 family protein [Planctomycetaceae bacterium]MDQ3332247.1 Hsp70 family protein [Planctomycetota bacterium]
MTSIVGHTAVSTDTAARTPTPAGQVVGIDFGASYSAVARLEPDGVPRLLPDAEGRELIDSVLSFGENGAVRVGRCIEATCEGGPVVTAVKRHLGERRYSLKHDGRRLSPEFLSALILRKLAQDAGRFGDLAGVILTVPSYFFAPGRHATLAAGRIADLPVVELLAEPIAAALSHLWRTGCSPKNDRTLLVFDLGGGTFDVTIVRVSGGRLEVAATEGDNALGGIDWTTRLVDFAGEKFRRRHRTDPRSDTKCLQRLTADCEQAKCVLATKPRTVVEVNHAGVTMPLGISREEFDQITADLLRRARDATEFLFESSGIDPDDLDEVLLVGGGTKVPAVAAMMTELCGRPVAIPPDPQRAVAEGAAVYAAAVGLRDGLIAPSDDLRRRLETISLRDVNAHSLGIALDDPRGKAHSRNHILIPRNTALPAIVKRRFVTSLANPEGIALRLVEGEAPEVAGCTVIGDWQITGLPSDLPAGAPVQVTFRCDGQRRVTLEAKELTGPTVAHVERVSLDGPAMENDRHLLAQFRLV